MKRWLRYLLAVLMPLMVVVFTGLRPGVYVGPCDGTQTTEVVDESGAMDAVECQSVALLRTTEGGSITCQERAR
jgi:hypothetical protein